MSDDAFHGVLFSLDDRGGGDRKFRPCSGFPNRWIKGRHERQGASSMLVEVGVCRWRGR